MQAINSRIEFGNNPALLWVLQIPFNHLTISACRQKGMVIDRLQTKNSAAVACENLSLCDVNLWHCLTCVKLPYASTHNQTNQ